MVAWGRILMLGFASNGQHQSQHTHQHNSRYSQYSNPQQQFHSPLVRSTAAPAFLTPRIAKSHHRSAAPGYLNAAFAQRAKKADSGAEDNSSSEISYLEKEVVAASQAKVDVKRLKAAMEEADVDDTGVADALSASLSSASDYILASIDSLSEASVAEGMSAQDKQRRRRQVESTVRILGDRTKVALTSAFTFGIGSTIVTDNIYVGLFFAIMVLFLGNADPTKEESVAGPILRMIGRFVIVTVEMARPKVRAITRAAMTDKGEVDELQDRIQELDDQKEELRQWKNRRLLAEEMVAMYKLKELKDMAKENSIAADGTKMQLLIRLLDEGVL